MHNNEGYFCAVNEARHQQSVDVRLSSLDELRKRTNLTRNQLGFWLGQRIAPSSTAYNLAQLYSLQADVNPDYFKAAFAAVVERSDALRTRFVEEDGIPRQVVAPALDYSMPLVDFSNEEDADDKLKEWCAGRVSKPFNLAERCFDVALIRLGSGDWAWYLGMHHLISDGVTMYLVLDYVADFYRLARDGRLGDAEDLPQFSGYLEKERSYRESEACRRDGEFWRPRLEEPREPAEYYGNRRADGATACRRLSVPLERSRIDKLLVVDEKSSGTDRGRDFDRLIAYLAVLAVYQLRVANSRRLTVGMPFHNRSSADKKGIIGLLMEVVPLRIDVGPDDSFRELLLRARAEAQSIRRHYRYGSVNPPRDQTYELMLNLLPPDAGSFEGAPVKAKWLHTGEGIEAMAVAIQRLPGDAGDNFYFDLNNQLFPENIAARATEHFLNLIDVCTANPDAEIGGFDFLTDKERLVIAESHAEPVSSPSDQLLTSRFERLAAEAPSACAIDDGVVTLSYHDLNRRANQVAAYLGRRGAGPETLVGVCMERSAQMVAALLGVLKSGAAYLPLDPAFPHDRLRFMLQDSAARLIITDPQSVGAVPEGTIEKICLDQEWRPVDQVHADVPHKPISGADSLAYVIYTSGSTGTPKGVQVTHGNVVNFLQSMARQPGLEGDDRLLAVTTLSFDISVLELFLPLSVGATAVLASRAASADPSRLLQLLDGKNISVVQATPATWRMLVEAGWRGDRRLKVLCGGEAFPEDLAKELATRAGQVWNMYGPTETTVWSTCCRIGGVAGPLPIGKPIDNTQIRVLDERMQAVPLGVPGELFIGGAGVARGYLNRPGLTAERFVSIGGSVYYRTGDAVRHLEDGSLEYRNRLDNQVKLHGHRIELGEIEEAMRCHEEIRDAAVVVREDEPGDQRLVAYYVAAPDKHQLPAGELRSHLRRSLPDYMVPQYFTNLPELPLTPNNKIDRKRLPLPVQQESRTIRPPENDVEKKLLGIWQSVLKSRDFGIDDNFFDVGGSSILSVQLSTRLEREFGAEVPVVTLYERPTIKKLAGYLSGDAAEGNVRDVARARVGRRKPQARRPALRKVTGND